MKIVKISLFQKKKKIMEKYVQSSYILKKIKKVLIFLITLSESGLKTVWSHLHKIALYSNSAINGLIFKLH